MFGAFADRVDALIAGAQIIVDHDAALDLEPRILGQRHVRPDADRHHDEIGRKGAAVLQPHRLDLAVAQDRAWCWPRSGSRCRASRSPSSGDRRHWDRAGAPSASASGARRWSFMPLAARPAAASRPSRPPPITTAWPPLPAASSIAFTSSRSRNVTTPGRSAPGTGIRIGREPVAITSVSYDSKKTGLRAHGFRRPVDRDDGLALAEIDVVLRVPGVIVDDDIVECLFAGEHRRKHDAVVIDARLRAENRHVVSIGRAREQLFEHAARRHAVAEQRRASVWTILLYGSFHSCACQSARSEAGMRDPFELGVTTTAPGIPKDCFALFLSFSQLWLQQPPGGSRH